LEVPYNRDLSDPTLWERSLRRSMHRREITEAARKHAARRKGAAVVVSASMAAGPTLTPLAAVARSGGDSAVAASVAAKQSRSAISLPSGALVSYGDVGEKVVAVQQQVGVDDDGIFGPITRGAVERFQARYGLPVTGEVDARTWQALFKSQVSFVGQGGKQVMTVYKPARTESRTVASQNGTGGAAAEDRTRTRTPATPDGSKPAASVPTTTKQTGTTRKTSRPSTDSAPATTPAPSKPMSTTPAAAPAPAPAAAGGCGAGRLSAPVSGTTTGTYGESRPGHSHAGKDIAAPSGTAVRAAQCGTVTRPVPPPAATGTSSASSTPAA
jgi:Meckel syndrome type 1 protein